MLRNAETIYYQVFHMDCVEITKNKLASVIKQEKEEPWVKIKLYYYYSKTSKDMLSPHTHDTNSISLMQLSDIKDIIHWWVETRGSKLECMATILQYLLHEFIAVTPRHTTLLIYCTFLMLHLNVWPLSLSWTRLFW